MQTPEASTSSRRGLGARAPRPSAPTPRLEGRGPGGDTPEARRVARVLGTSGVRGLCAEPPRRRAAWPPPPVGAVEVETGPAVGTGARRQAAVRKPRRRVKRVGAGRPPGVHCSVPGGCFHGEGLLCGRHQSQGPDVTSEETQALKPGTFTLDLEKAKQRKHELSSFVAHGRW